MTFEEYLALPDDGELRHAEFVDGDVIVMNRRHGLRRRMQRKLLVALQHAAPTGHEVLTEWDWVTVAGSPVSDPATCQADRGLCLAKRLTSRE